MSNSDELPSESPFTQHEPLTLDNTALGLVDDLRHMIDEYGLAGVRGTLDLIEADTSSCDTLGCDGFGVITDERTINGDVYEVIVGECPLHENDHDE